MFKKKVKILFSEENEEIINYIKENLKNYPIECFFESKNGFEIINKTLKLVPDFLVVDLFMENIDAISVILKLKKEKIDVPKFMIVLSHFDSNFESEFFTIDKYNFITRPYKIENMIQKILNIFFVENDKNYTNDINSDENSNKIELKVSETLRNLGIPAHIKGYKYLKRSIINSILGTELKNNVTKGLYFNVANFYDTTPTRVERAMRHAIETAWDRGNVDELNSVFGSIIHISRGKPTNSEFVATISEKLKFEIKNIK